MQCVPGAPAFGGRGSFGGGDTGQVGLRGGMIQLSVISNFQLTSPLQSGGSVRSFSWNCDGFMLVAKLPNLSVWKRYSGTPFNETAQLIIHN